MKPGLIHLDDVAWEEYPADNGVGRLKQLVSPDPQGSKLGMCLTELPPGHKTMWWSFLRRDNNGPDKICFGDGRYETYFILAGRVRMTTCDPKGNEENVEGGPGDSFYLAPGYQHRVSNIGNRPALFLFSFMSTAW